MSHFPIAIYALIALGGVLGLAVLAAGAAEFARVVSDAFAGITMRPLVLQHSRAVRIRIAATQSGDAGLTAESLRMR